MAQFPALPLWTDAYLADTLDLDATDHGVYLLMMMIAWRRPDCALPDDMKWLKRSLQASAADLHGHTFNARVPRLLERFWDYTPPEKDGQNVGKWFQKRLQKERKYLENKSEAQSKRARKRWDNKDLDDAVAMPPRNAPTPTPTPTPIEEPPSEDAGASHNGTSLEECWAKGPAVLVAKGIPSKQARTVLGKWLRDHDADRVLEGIEALYDSPTQDPVPYVEAILIGQTKSKRARSDAELEAVFARLDEKERTNAGA